MISNESAGSDENLSPTRQTQSHSVSQSGRHSMSQSGRHSVSQSGRHSVSQSRQAQYPFTGRENMTHPVDIFNDTSGFREADVDFFNRITRIVDNPIAEGQVYESREALRVAVQEFHIQKNFEFRTLRSEPRRMAWICKDKLCKFKLCAKPQGISESWIIYKQKIPHACKVPATREDHDQLTAEMVARAIDGTVRRDVCVSINHIRDVVKAKYKNVTPKYNKLWRGRELAIANIYGSWESSYNLLSPLLEAIKRGTPGTKYCVISTPIENSNDRQFLYAAWAYGPCIAAIPFIRPVISIDACFLSGRYQGRLLVACGYDAENQLLPLAFAIVEKEHSDTWGFFMRWLRLEVIGDGRFFCVISDRHLAIKSVFQDPHLRWYEDSDLCVHRYCAHHVAENLYKYVGRKREVSDRFKIGVNKKKPRRLQEMYEDFQISCPDAITYINKVGKRDPDDEDEPPRPEKLFQAYDGGHRWGIMTTNGAESINNVFKTSRRLPVCALVEETFYKLNRWFFQRRNKAEMMFEAGQLWSDKVSQLLQKRINKSLNMQVIPFGRRHGTFEVMVKGERIPARRNQQRFEYTRRDFGYKVVIKDNNKVECACQKPQLTGIPCSHFMAVVREMRYDENLYINPLYSVSMLVQTWAAEFGPKGNQCEWPTYEGPTIKPNRKLIKKGRRRHNRIVMEMDRMEGRRLGHQAHRETIDRNAAGIIQNTCIF